MYCVSPLVKESLRIPCQIEVKMSANTTKNKAVISKYQELLLLPYPKAMKAQWLFVHFYDTIWTLLPSVVLTEVSSRTRLRVTLLRKYETFFQRINNDISTTITHNKNKLKVKVVFLLDSRPYPQVLIGYYQTMKVLKSSGNEVVDSHYPFCYAVKLKKGKSIKEKSGNLFFESTFFLWSVG